MPEVWKPIPGFPGYHASCQGNIRGLKGTNLRPTTGSPAGYPHITYKKVGLYVNKKRRWLLVHRAVLLAFYGEPPEGKPDGCHKNHDAHDNRAANLQWQSHLDNCAERTTTEAEERRMDRDQDRAICDEASGNFVDVHAGQTLWWVGTPF